MARLNGFDIIAPIYDRLAALVYGRAIRDAQLHFADRIPLNAKVLVLGGGTGWLAEAIMLGRNLRVVYVDASEKMIALARKRLTDFSNIRFVHGTETDVPDETYDVIIANFYFDLFDEKELERILDKFSAWMNAHGILLCTDFADEGKWWHRMLLWSMYRFFRICCGIPACRLPRWEIVIGRKGLVKTDEAVYFGGFIKSAVYNLTGAYCPARAVGSGRPSLPSA